MKKTKILKIFVGLIVVLSICGCGKSSTTKEGTAVKFSGGKISADTFYDEIKEEKISTLIDMIDHKLLDEDYKSDDDENKEVKEQIDSIKQYYTEKDQFENIIKQYYGVENEEELEKMLRIKYKKTQAFNDYIEKKLTDNEIQTYYDEKIVGEMKASHILISVDVDSEADDEKKEKAEEEAKKKAEDIIKELDEGKDFAKLAKKYSDDEATKEKGGDLNYFEYEDMEQAFSEATKNLEVNKYTNEPVKTSYGYHIILKTGQKDKPKLKKVKDKIKEKLREQKLNADKSLYYESLISFREDKKINWNDDKLKEAYDDYMKELIDNASGSSN